MEYSIEEIAEYVNEKISVSKIGNSNYISTENMLPNRKGIVYSSKIPSQNKVNYFKNGDILISNIRPYFKKIWYAKFDGGCSNDVLVIRVKDEDIISSKYLYYLLSRDIFFNYVMSGSKGTKMPRGDRKQILKYRIKVPVLEKQYKIINAIDVIEKKIELNNQINNNLYQFAITYLNSKISDDEVPVNYFGKIQGGYAFKSKDLKEEKTKNRVIKIKNLRSEINADINSTQFIDDEVTLKIDKKFKLQKGDVAIAMTGAELGKTGFIYGNDKYYLNQRVGIVKGNDVRSELYLRILMLSNEFQLLLNSKGYGSAQPNISTFDIESVMIKNITKENLDDFYKIIYPIYNKIINNCEENLILEQLKNILLPKLMNGEIDLDKIKI